MSSTFFSSLSPAFYIHCQRIYSFFGLTVAVAQQSEHSISPLPANAAFVYLCRYSTVYYIIMQVEHNNPTSFFPQNHGSYTNCIKCLIHSGLCSTVSYDSENWTEVPCNQWHNIYYYSFINILCSSNILYLRMEWNNNKCEIVMQINNNIIR